MNLYPAALSIPMAALAATAAFSPLDAGSDLQASQMSLDSMKRIQLQANTFTENRQQDASIAFDGAGNSLVVWGSRRQEAGDFGIFAQRFDPWGRRLGVEMHINQSMAGQQTRPAVAFDRQNRAHVIWESFRGGQSQVLIRSFGTTRDVFGPLGDEQELAISRNELLTHGGLATSPSGKLLATWTQDAGRQSQVFARCLDARGEPLGPAQALAQRPNVRADLANPVAIGPQDFVVVWASADAQGAQGIRARHYDGTTGEWAASNELVTAGIEPALDATGGAHFALAWLAPNGDEGYQVRARRFAPDGTSQGEELVFPAPAAAWVSGVEVAGQANGSFVVAHNVEHEKRRPEGPGKRRPFTPSEILAYTVDAGDRISPSGHVHEAANAVHQLTVASTARRMARTDDGRLAVTWFGQTGHGDHKGVGLSLFVPSDAVAPALAQVDPTPAQIEGPSSAATLPPVFDPDFVPMPTDEDQPAGVDFGFTAIGFTGWTPPDPDIAAGPDHIVAVVNGEIAILDKEGNSSFRETLNDFWRPVGSQTFVFDPVAYYDHHSNRFFVGAAEHSSNRDYLVLAVSDDSDPNGTWHKYRWNVDSIADYIDFPNFGVGPDAVYFACDYFGWPSGNYIHVIEKTPLLTGRGVSIVPVKTSPFVVSLGAVKSYDPNPPAQYFARTDGRDQIWIEAIGDPVSDSPTRDSFSLTVDAFATPPDARQKGTSNRAATIDERIKNGVYRNGSLWLSHTIGEESTARVRWYEIEMNGWPAQSTSPTLRQSGTFNYGNGQYNWFPDIHVDDEGNAAITCNRSSTSDYIYVARAVRRANDPPGEFRASVRLQESSSPETGDRWGDYSGIDESPTEPGVFWGLTEYRTSGWTTWASRIDVNQCMVAEGGPFTRGTRISLDIRSAAQQRKVYVLFSFAGPGSTYISQLDVTSGLTNPILAGTVSTDASGAATFSAFLPSAAPKRPVWIQVVERGNTSNVIATSIRD